MFFETREGVLKSALTYIAEHFPHTVTNGYDETALWDAAITHAIGGPSRAEIERVGIRRNQFSDDEWVRLLESVTACVLEAGAGDAASRVAVTATTLVPAADLSTDEAENQRAAEYYWTLATWLVNVQDGLSQATSDLEFGPGELDLGSSC